MFGVGGGVGLLIDSIVCNYVVKILGEEFYFNLDVKVEVMQCEGDKVFICYLDDVGLL